MTERENTNLTHNKPKKLAVLLGFYVSLTQGRIIWEEASQLVCRQVCRALS